MLICREVHGSFQSAIGPISLEINFCVWIFCTSVLTYESNAAGRHVIATSTKYDAGSMS